MSSRKRPSTHSHRSRSPGHHSLSVTQASLEDFHLGDTASDPYLSVPSAYPSSSHDRRPSSNTRTGSSSDYLQAPYDAGSYSTLQYPSFDPDAFPFLEEESSFPTGAAGSSSTMSGYPYAQDIPSSAEYRGSGGYGTTSSAQDYSNPSTEASLSRGMSGPPSLMLPGSVLPSSTYEFREAGRDVARQRRRNVAQVRHEHKSRTRRAALLPSMPGGLGSSEAGVTSGLIDSFAAQSGSSFGGARSPYSHHHSPSLHSGGFGGHSPSYTYPGGGYTTAPPYNTYGGSTLGPQSAYGSSGHSRRSGGPGTPHADRVILEQPKKPQCWEHGCNGRYFSTFSNLLRHQREKSGTSHKSVCHRCGAEFTRKTARDGHLNHDKCKGGRRERD